MGRRVKINNQKFVEAWMTMPTVDKVADHFGVGKTVVTSKVHYLRNLGVDLPKKKKSRRLTYTIEELNDIVYQYEPKRANTVKYSGVKLWRKS